MVSAHKKTCMLSEWLLMVAVYRKLCVLLDGCIGIGYRKLLAGILMSIESCLLLVGFMKLWLLLNRKLYAFGWLDGCCV
jgi:hypothetical protein